MIDIISLIFYIFIGLLAVNLASLLIRSLVILLYSEKTSSEKSPPISIIISARNEAENLKSLIPKLMEQDYYDFEVSVALDRCSDDSLDIMKIFEKQYDNLKTVIIDELPDHFSPKKYALTLGAKGASNEWLLFTDADCRPQSENWLSGFANQMTSDTDVLVGYAPYSRKNGLLNAYIRFETFMTASDYLSSVLLKNPYMGVGRNLAFRKSLFLKVKGYNRFQGIMGGDDDLFVHYHAKPSRTRVVFGPDTLVYSDAKDSLKNYWKQKKRHFSVGKYYRFSSKLRHTFKFLAMILLWATFIILAILGYQPIIVSGSFIGYFVIKGLLDWRVANRIGDGYRYILNPILEGIYITFVPAASVVAAFTKKVKWK